MSCPAWESFFSLYGDVYPMKASIYYPTVDKTKVLRLCLQSWSTSAFFFIINIFCINEDSFIIYTSQRPSEEFTTFILSVTFAKMLKLHQRDTTLESIVNTLPTAEAAPSGLTHLQVGPLTVDPGNVASHLLLELRGSTLELRNGATA